MFGPTLLAIAAKWEGQKSPQRVLTESKTYKRLGYDPVGLDDGMRLTVDWLRDIGRLDS